jgi:hypothetical protein
MELPAYPECWIPKSIGAYRTLDLFRDSSLPRGFEYRPDFLSREEEHSLLQHIKDLPFREFEFHCFTGKWWTVSFGWRYDFKGGGLTKTEDMPDVRPSRPVRKARRGKPALFNYVS